MRFAWLIPSLPAAAFFLIVFFGKRMPYKGAEIGITAVLASLVMSFVVGGLFIAGGGPVLHPIRYLAAGTANIPAIRMAAEHHQIATGTLTVAALLLFGGAIGKSAQFPLHVWLPDAMAGPTPVSALIHAATMVAAGVYMIGRLFAVFAPSGHALAFVGAIGSITMLIAALLAMVQDDIKRVLAYSTVSQLAYMVAALGLGEEGYTPSLFHLFTHAFFKALLFLGAGSVIHAV